MKFQKFPDFPAGNYLESDNFDQTKIHNVLRTINREELTENSISHSLECNSVYRRVKQMFKNLEENDFKATKYRDTQKISELNDRYKQEFYEFSRSFEKWAANRRATLKHLDDVHKILTQIRLYCNGGKFALSSFSFAASIASIALYIVDIKWSLKLLYVGATIGSLNLMPNLFELYSTRSSLEKITRILQQDKESFELVEKFFRSSSFVDEFVSNLFPYGVNKRIVMEISDFGTESNSLKESQDEVAFSSIQEQIFFAIVLSNVLKDKNLLNDEEFIDKVRMFSKSSIAVKWWHRIKYKYLKYKTEETKLVLKLKSQKDADSLLPFPLIAFATFPLSDSDYLMAILMTAVLNGLITFDAYCQLFISYPSNDLETLRRLKRFLRKDYKQLKELYDALDPYSDCIANP